MAVELKKFQAELQKLDSASDSAFGERKTVGDSEGNTKKLLAGARLAIGDRVQFLRTQNVQGAKVSDFADDKEVKAALALADQALNNFKAIEARKLKAHATIKKLYADYGDLADRVDAEVADRKKKLFEPKSLPDMVKLGKTVRTTITEEGGLKTESIKDVALSSVPKAGALEAAFRTELELEVKKSAGVRANAALSDATEKFKPRLMKLRSDRVKGLAQETEKLCAGALAAHKAANAKLAKQALDTAVSKCLEMTTIVDDYNDAYRKNKSFFEQNPDHKTIFAMVSGLTTISNRVLKEVSSTQTALK